MDYGFHHLAGVLDQVQDGKGDLPVGAAGRGWPLRPGSAGRRTTRGVAATGNADRAHTRSQERAREQAKSEGKDSEQAQPTKKAQYNFTDPESRILKGPDGFVQGYNTQIAVESVFQLIVG
jgi:hypothetical protein